MRNLLVILGIFVGSTTQASGEMNNQNWLACVRAHELQISVFEAMSFKMPLETIQEEFEISESEALEYFAYFLDNASTKDALIVEAREDCSE
jgi:ABC-type molybdate transport system substrate-binding protein